MKPPDFDYVAPSSLDEALAALGADPEAKVLAGGQSLIPLLAFRLAHPTTLVDLAGIDELGRIQAKNGTVAIGAMVRQRRAENDALLAERCPLLIEALAHVGHPQIRSRGTIGGSVAHADPAAEIPAVVAALGGRARVAGPDGERTIADDELFQGFLTTSIAANEILVEVELPVAPPKTGCACVEVARRPGDYAICGAVCQVSIDDTGAPADARLSLISVGDRPSRATAAEQAFLAGASPTEAGALAREGLSPADDVQATGDYRIHVAGILAGRALEQAMQRAS